MSLTAVFWVTLFWALSLYAVGKIHDIAKSLEKIANNTEKEGEQK